MKAYCMPWHKSFSNSVNDYLIDPLVKYEKIELHGWNGSDNISIDNSEPVIFCQLLPPKNVLEDNARKVIWIPMWDSVYSREKEWWTQIPDHVRIVAFSKHIETIARQTGHDVLKLKFYKDPKTFAPANWSKPLCLFYWNRTNLVSASFLKIFCKALSIKQLIIINRPDPGYLPFTDNEISHLSRYLSVKSYTSFLDLSVLQNLLSSSHLYIAPRKYEGIGMSFIESMCSGHCVFSIDEVTMNEYICHNKTGIFLKKDIYKPTINQKLINKFKRILNLPIYDLPENAASLTYFQDWDAMNEINFSVVGQNAVQSMHDGFIQWQSQTKEFYNFLVTW